MDLMQIMKATGELYGKTVSDVAARMFLADLSNYDGEQINAALQKCRKELRTFPTVADVVARIQDGRLGVEEAWALLPKSESDSVVWTEEMAAAFGACRELIETDVVAARMAFKEVYTRLVSEARNAGKAVTWSPSLGHDPTSRAAALDEAVRLGRLAISQATAVKQGQIEVRRDAGGQLRSIGTIIKQIEEKQ